MVGCDRERNRNPNRTKLSGSHGAIKAVLLVLFLCGLGTPKGSCVFSSFQSSKKMKGGEYHYFKHVCRRAQYTAILMWGGITFV